MATLTLVVPKEFPVSGPLRIIVSVEGYSLHHLDLTRDKFISRPRPSSVSNASPQIARLALNTCLRPDVTLSDVDVEEAYMGHSANDSWSVIVKVGCAISSTGSDPSVVYLESNKELNDEGNVECIAVVPRTAKARAKYVIFSEEDGIFETQYLETDLEPTE